MAKQCVYKSVIDKPLCRRELQCYALFVFVGLTAKECAQRLNISKVTVDMFRARGIEKCGAKNINSAVASLNKKGQIEQMFEYIKPHITAIEEIKVKSFVEALI